jgi:YbbR domain-containing protein
MIAFLRTLLFEDFRLKVFSLALAILIWFTVSFVIRNEVSPLGNLTLTTQQMTFFNVPVVVMSSAADVHDFRVDPKEVTVTVQGEPRMVEKLESKSIRALIDLTGTDAVGDLRKRVEVSTPSGVTHVRVTPPEVRVIFPPPGTAAHP